MSVCTHVCAHVCVCVRTCMWRQEDTGCPLLLSTFSLESGLFLNMESIIFIHQSGWCPASPSKLLSNPPHLGLGYKHSESFSQFYMKAGDLNLGPLIVQQEPLSTEHIPVILLNSQAGIITYFFLTLLPSDNIIHFMYSAFSLENSQ